MNLEYCFLMSVYRMENPDYLVKSIDSMLFQTITAKKIVIVEDGELTESLEKIIMSYETRFPYKFLIIRRKENKGLGFSLNEGLQYCETELIARMDSDDICFKERCEKQLKRFNEVQELAILGTQIREFEEEVKNVKKQRMVPLDYPRIVEFSHRRSPFNHPTVMFKKSIILKYGGYPPVKRKEDLKLFIEVVNDKNYCENLPDILLNYRSNSDNYKRRKTWVNCKEYIEIMNNFYKRKIINSFDYVYVVSGQLIIFLMPTFIGKFITNAFLRK
ncbi:MAG: glycosyltransferase [Bacilli bacterium]